MKAKWTARDIVTLVPHFLRLYIGILADNRVHWMKKSFIPLVVAYILNPFDFIPDFIPIIGKLDDALLSFMAVSLLLKTTDRAIILDHWSGDPGVFDDIVTMIDVIIGLIPAKFKFAVTQLNDFLTDSDAV